MRAVPWGHPPSAHLRNPQRAADMHPLGATSGGLQRPSSLGAEQALRLDTQGARPAQPAARGHLEDPIACLGAGRGGLESERHRPLHSPALSYTATRPLVETPDEGPKYKASREAKCLQGVPGISPLSYVLHVLLMSAPAGRKVTLSQGQSGLPRKGSPGS